MLSLSFSKKLGISKKILLGLNQVFMIQWTHMV